MKIPVLWAVLTLPMFLGGTACSRNTGQSSVIVRVDSRGDRSGWLGVSIQDMTARLAKAMDVKTDEGALVNEVDEDSPADDAGLKEEDIIVQMDGKKILNADDLQTKVRETKPGTKVNFTVMRSDERKILDITIGKTPTHRSYSFSITPPHLPRIPRLPRGPMHIEIFRDAASLGMTLSTLNEQLGKYFGAPNGKGVLVQEVEENSKAEKAGFRAGDVIIKVGKESVEESRDVVDALRDFDRGEKVEVEIMRKGATRTLTLEVPEMRRHHRHWFGFHNGDWFDDFDVEINPPDLDHHFEKENGTLREWLDDIKKELNQLSSEIERKVEDLREELKSARVGLMS